MGGLLTNYMTQAKFKTPMVKWCTSGGIWLDLVV